MNTQVEALAQVPYASKYRGLDNYQQPKEKYIAKVVAMDDDGLAGECYSMIYQSARCANRPRADWHWMVDVCYDECKRRGKPEMYKRAYDNCVRDHT